MIKIALRPIYIFFFLIFSFGVFFFATRAAGNTYYVDKDSIGGTYNNANLSTVYTPVRSALSLNSKSIYLRTDTYSLINIISQNIITTS